MAFGVELPADFSKDLASQGGSSDPQLAAKDTMLAPDGDSQSTAPEGEKSSEEKLQEIIDLDKTQKFKWQGKEWTAEELRKATLLQSDYTKKTQELAETRKYADNFATDLERVLRNPDLLGAMAKVYPKEYVARARSILAMRSPNAEAGAPEGQKSETNLPPELQEKLSKLDEILEWREQEAKRAQEMEVERIEERIDNAFNKFGKTYQYADEAAVLAKLSAAVDSAKMRGEQLELTDKLVETLFKQSHERISQLISTQAKNTLKTQQAASKKALDTGTGGEPATKPPVKMTMKEAKAAMERHLMGG
jgi:hypothetical protein